MGKPRTALHRHFHPDGASTDGRHLPADPRQLLLSRRRQLLARVRQEHRDLHGQADSTMESLGDLGDRPVLTPDAELRYGLVGSRAALLRQIDHALEELDRGTYGRCQDCDRPIPPVRLVALPSAVRCMPCQAMQERGEPA